MPNGKYSRQKTTFLPRNRGTPPDRVFPTPRFPDENAARAGGKYSKKPQKQCCDTKITQKLTDWEALLTKVGYASPIKHPNQPTFSN
jgi:hypothetical protein